MARAIYPHELGDPDFSWLISNFRENHPEYGLLEASCLPVVLIAGAGYVEKQENEATLPPEEIAADAEQSDVSETKQ